MANWNHLPSDLVPEIARYLNTYTDYVRFRAVCGSWENNLPKWPQHLFSKIPWLMISHRGENEKLQGFYNPSNEELCYLELPPVTNNKYVGSSSGWLVTLDNGLTLKLLNPLTKSQIPLPPISSFPDVIDYDPNRRGEEYTVLCPMYKTCNQSQAHVHKQYVRKIVLSSNDHHFVAIAIYSPFNKLAFTKYGDDKWTAVSTSLTNFHDCIFFDGKIYAVNRRGELGVSSIDHPTELVNLPLKQPKLEVTSKIYLVERDGDLLIVERLLAPFSNGQGCDGYETVGFNLFEMDSDGWLKINDLDGYTIFLGLNSSICISSKYRPKLRGNHIYYAFDQNGCQALGSNGCYDFGIFDMTDGSRLWKWYDDDPSNPSVWPHPIWTVLNPY